MIALLIIIYTAVVVVLFKVLRIKPTASVSREFCSRAFW